MILLHRPKLTLPTYRYFVVWLGLVALMLCCYGGLSAQESSAPVFPEERYKELREEVVFTPPEEKEEEKKEEKDAADGSSWFNDQGDFSVGDLKLSKPVVYVILLLMLSLLGFGVYRILGDVELRRRTRINGEEEEDEISIEEIEEETLVASGVSLSLQERAEQNGQFDIAVRLLYIQLLKNLQDNGLIKYRRDYSNRDYQIQLNTSELLGEFREVTVDYERYWYGKYAIDPLSYRLVKRKFTALSSRIILSTKSTSPHA